MHNKYFLRVQLFFANDTLLVSFVYKCDMR